MIQFLPPRRTTDYVPKTSAPVRQQCDVDDELEETDGTNVDIKVLLQTC